MNRFIRFFKRLFVPTLSHDASREAKKRVSIASRITDDQIHLSTIRNALNTPDATLSDKLTFAFSSLPDTLENFPSAKGMFFDILEFLESNKEISTEEALLMKSALENITSFEDLMVKMTSSG